MAGIPSHHIASALNQLHAACPVYDSLPPGGRAKQRMRHRPRKYKHVNKPLLSNLNADAPVWTPTPPTTPVASGRTSPALGAGLHPHYYALAAPGSSAPASSSGYPASAPTSPEQSAPSSPTLGGSAHARLSLPSTPSGSMLNLVDSGLGSAGGSVSHLCASLTSLDMGHTSPLSTSPYGHGQAPQPAQQQRRGSGAASPHGAGAPGGPPRFDDDDVDDGHALLHNYLYHKYVRFRDRALEQRRVTGAGNSPLVKSLYDFWVERLLHKFNRNMYATFKEVALLDAADGSRYGVEQLYRFYRKSLLAFYRERVFRDFLFVISTEIHEHNFGVEMLWMFLKERGEEVVKVSEESVQKRVCGWPQLWAALQDLESFSRFSLD